MTLMKLENVTAAPLEEGDAGIVLKPDGSFRVFSSGKIDRDDLTPAQQEQGEKLVALMVALQHPEVMGVLLRLSRDPAIVGDHPIDLGRAN